MKPIISLIVPVYNSSKYITRCVESLINQTLTDIEIILVNDGSTDDSLQKLNEYQVNYPDKIIILNQENAGQSVARNNGVKLANGEFIMFVDSDDWVDANICQVLYDDICKYNSDISICGINNYFSETPVEELNLRLFYKNKFIPNFIVVPFAKLFRKSFWDKFAFSFHEGIYYEDFDLLPRVLFSTEKITFTDKPLYNYERRNQNSTTNIHKKSDYMFLIMDRLYSFYKSNKTNKDFEVFYLKHILHLFYTYNQKDNIDKIKQLINSKRDMLILSNCMDMNQKLLVLLFKLRMPLNFIIYIVELRNKLFRAE